jgi:ferric-dicitrate binding protein FerR (iron transport regulator)
MTTMYRTLRERQAWDRRKQAEKTMHDDPGLRDMKSLLAQAQAEETSSMRAAGYLFAVFLGACMGVILAAWWFA